MCIAHYLSKEVKLYRRKHKTNVHTSAMTCGMYMYNVQYSIGMH